MTATASRTAFAAHSAAISSAATPGAAASPASSRTRGRLLARAFGTVVLTASLVFEGPALAANGEAGDSSANVGRHLASAAAHLAAAAEQTAPVPHENSAPIKRPDRNAQGKKVIYLTFDDGASSYTPQILDVLAQNHAHATFFMVGPGAQQHPDLVKRIRANGNAVGNHTWKHKELPKLSDGAIRDEISRTEAATGPTKCVRPPYGATNKRVRGAIESIGHHSVLWDVDTRDWSRPGVNKIVREIKRGARPGAIILMHDGGGNRSQSVQALRSVLPDLAAEGYVFEALPDCL